MSQPTPKYNKGDRIELKSHRASGVISERWWSETNNTWLYRISRNDDDKIGVYQEKNLSQ